MNNDSASKSIDMPNALAILLTNRLLCAVLAVLMLTSAYWFNLLFGNLKLIAFIFLLFGVLLHLAVPSLLALTTLGGGAGYSLQVGGIAAILLLIVSSGSALTTVVFLMLFVLLPVVVAQAMQRKGLGHAGWVLVIALFVGFALAMVVMASPLDLEVFVSQQFKPMFEMMITRIPPEASEDILSMQKLQSLMVKIFPGFFIFGIWLIWWSDLIFARSFAQKYNFYQGDADGVLSFALPKVVGFVLLALLAFANFTMGNLQYLAINGVIVLAAMVTVQGIIVAHSWLKSRGMGSSIIVMYTMLFFWSFVIVLFALLGLLDMRFKFRRNFVSATGEK